MRVQYHLSAAELRELVMDGLRRRGIIRRGVQADVLFTSGGTSIQPMVSVSVEAQFPPEPPIETAALTDMTITGKIPATKPRGPRSAMERLNGDDEI